MSPLSNEVKRALLDLARQSISSAILHRRLPELPASEGEPRQCHGVFVTLHHDGRLRGCVGQIAGDAPLQDAVVRAAISAALHDPRFLPVTSKEIPQLDIEISVLSAPQPITPQAIIPGLHGLIVAREGKRGLLLPQVAASRNWSAQRLMEETCSKAELEREAWRDPATQILGFTAEVFSEAAMHSLPQV